jgi:DNA-binding IclR family transcriptional regulator
LDGERLLTPIEVECLLALLRHTAPQPAAALAEQLDRKAAGVTRALGGLDALGYALLRLEPSRWELTERGRMVALRIAATKRTPRSIP